MNELKKTEVKRTTWVQTEKAAHEAWAALIGKSPKAAQLMHLLTARIGDNNAVIISQKNLMRLMGCSRRTIQRALNTLSADRWIEIRQIGETGSVNAYVLNDRVAWMQPRDNLRYSLFSATVIVSDDEQPDHDDLDTLEPLRKLPIAGELQNPAGAGLPPPSQPSLPSMEPDLPETGYQIDIEDFTNANKRQ